MRCGYEEADALWVGKRAGFAEGRQPAAATLPAAGGREGGG